jgi:hypothetical protein
MSLLIARTSFAVALVVALGAGLSAAPILAAEKSSASQESKSESKAETVEQRIVTLHKKLKITADQEDSWNHVAQAMRDNAAAMEKLIADEKTAHPAAQTVSAVEDLKTYEAFSQAHVDGLKNLIAAFGTLYDSMPDAQKKIADHVFSTSGHHHTGHAHA